MLSDSLDQFLASYLRRSIGICCLHEALRSALVALLFGSATGMLAVLWGLPPWWIPGVGIAAAALAFAYRVRHTRRILSTPAARLELLHLLEQRTEAADALTTLDSGVAHEFEAALRAELCKHLDAISIRDACLSLNTRLVLGSFTALALSIGCAWWFEHPQIRGALLASTSELLANAPDAYNDPESEAETSAHGVPDQSGGSPTAHAGGVVSTAKGPGGLGGSTGVSANSEHGGGEDAVHNPPPRPWESTIPESSETAPGNETSVPKTGSGPAQNPDAPTNVPPARNPLDDYQRRDFHIVPEAADGDRKTISARRDVYNPRSLGSHGDAASSGVPQAARAPERHQTEFGACDESERAWAAEFARRHSG